MSLLLALTERKQRLSSRNVSTRDKGEANVDLGKIDLLQEKAKQLREEIAKVEFHLTNLKVALEKVQVAEEGLLAAAGGLDWDLEMDLLQEKAKQLREKIAKAEFYAMKLQVPLEKVQEAAAKGLPGNQDTSFPVRLGSVLAYFLPVVDSTRFWMPVAALVPPLAPLGALMFSVLKSPVPFITFLIWQFVSEKKELPVLLRFNLKQAIALWCTLSLVQLITFLAGFAVGNQGQLSPEVQAAIGVSVLIPVVLILAYCTVFNLLGMLPRGIPGLSQLAELGMGVLPPGIAEEEFKKIKEAEAKQRQKEKEEREKQDADKK